MTITKERLRQSRKLCSFPQQRMAQILGYSYGYYRQVERGLSPIPPTLTERYLREKTIKYLNDLTNTLEQFLNA